MSEDQIQLIQMDMIDRPVKISRKLIDPESVRELAESIREVGLLEPVLLRPSNGRFEVVAGDRRYLAHKLLERKEIKAFVRDLNDQETVVIRGIENLQRVDLSPSEEAGVYLVLKEEGGLSPKEIAKKLGKSHTTILRYLKFARCSVEVQRAVDRKEVSLNVLEILLEIDDPVAFDYHFTMAASNGISPSVARLWVDDYLKSKIGTYYSDGGGLPPSSVEFETKPVFVTCQCCYGPVEIHQAKQLIVCVPCQEKVRQMKSLKS